MSNPTAADKRMFARVVAVGCMACLHDGFHTNPENHHVKEYGYRNHKKTFGLCPPHHGIPTSVQGILNRHKNPKEFAAKYGTDQELWEKCQSKIKRNK